MDDGKSKIAAFRNDAEIILKPFPNGGWVVSSATGEWSMGVGLGAYSSAKEMLDALASALVDAE